MSDVIKVKNTYKDDCIFLLKDISDEVEEITIEEKERLIREGKSYSEFISKEQIPSDEINKIFLQMVEENKSKLAMYVARISELVLKEKGSDLVLVSLARGGTPYGILVKKYIKNKFNLDVPHYSLSIIRGKGLDINALQYILKKHKASNIKFIDGWTGKGSITREIKKSIDSFNFQNGTEIDSNLAVISDPAKLCRVCGTREDFGIPTSCLNATVSGLISRTIHNTKYIKSDDFHGVKYLGYLKDYDLSQYFINKISNEFEKIKIETIDLKFEEIDEEYAMGIVLDIQKNYNVKSINNIKLSVGETARVLLRRTPRVVIVNDINKEDVKHIVQLAKERQIEVVETTNNIKNEYNCISIISEK